jgi:hypothetical protein
MFSEVDLELVNLKEMGWIKKLKLANQKRNQSILLATCAIKGKRPCLQYKPLLMEILPPPTQRPKIQR